MSRGHEQQVPAVEDTRNAVDVEAALTSADLLDRVQVCFVTTPV
jgi:hypothetical protein